MQTNKLNNLPSADRPCQLGERKTRRDEQGNLLSINDLGHGGSDPPFNSMRNCFFNFTLFLSPMLVGNHAPYSFVTYLLSITYADGEDRFLSVFQGSKGCKVRAQLYTYFTLSPLGPVSIPGGGQFMSFQRVRIRLSGLGWPQPNNFWRMESRYFKGREFALLWAFCNQNCRNFPPTGRSAPRLPASTAVRTAAGPSNRPGSPRNS